MIDVKTRGGIARIFLNRHEKGNALDSRLLNELLEAFISLASEVGLRAAVIGAGLEIAAACDLRIAAEGTKFSMPEVRLGIPSVVEAALLPLVEEVGGDEAVERVLKSLLAASREALEMQKQLLQLWEEAPLATSIEKSIGLFARAKR